LTGGAVPQDSVSGLGFQNSSCIFVRPPEVALLNKLVFENLRQRPVRTCLSVLAIGVEVTMILTLVGISYGTLDETARRARGVGADIIVRPLARSIINLRKNEKAFGRSSSCTAHAFPCRQQRAMANDITERGVRLAVCFSEWLILVHPELAPN
jgi:ABC-type lipoprotein release transport system permease subunit